LTLLKKGWIATLLLLVPFTAGAMDIDWCVFRTQQFTVIQQFGNSFSGEVSWNPCFNLSDRIGVRGNFGGMVLKGFSGKFAAAEYEARLSYKLFRSLTVEAGGGAQTWFLKTGGTSPIVSAAVSWMFFRKLSWLRAGVTAGYSLFLPKDNTTHEARLGVALAFGNERK
jgi:hypothetical protein